MSEPEKKKRGRKKINVENIQISIETKDTSLNEVGKKRNRKPKGGKIISKEENLSETNNSVQNIILHLKCSLADLANDSNEINNGCFSYDPTVPEIQSFETQNKNKFSNYEEDNTNIKYAYTNDNSISINENFNLKNENNSDDIKIKKLILN